MGVTLGHGIFTVMELSEYIPMCVLLFIVKELLYIFFMFFIGQKITSYNR